MIMQNQYADKFCSSSLKIAALFFVVSVLVRIGFLIPITTSEVSLSGDEIGYYARAVVFKNIISHISSGELPHSEDLDNAYDKGFWPPFHSILLALGLFFGENIFFARLVVVILSALTTPLVYLLTLEFTTRKAAIFAAWTHILYPSFIAYSLFLWAETTYILLILLCVYYSALVLRPKADIDRKKILHASLSGCFLGLAGLTRAIILPYLLIIPLWITLRLKEGIRSRIVIFVIILTSCFITLLPWQATVMLKEERLVPISTAVGKNLYLGNNPWVPDGYGSLWGFLWGPSFKTPQLNKSVEEYSEQNSVSTLTAETVLAIQYIKQNPNIFIKRCFERLRMLWTSEFFLLRYIFSVVYPPLPSVVVLLVWIITLSTYITFIGLAVWGLFGVSSQFKNKGLILVLVIAGMVPCILTIAMSRLQVPFLALLLPAVGHGFVFIKQRVSFKRLVFSILTIILFLSSVFTSLPYVFKYYLLPSSYYSNLIGRIGEMINVEANVIDQIILRKVDNALPENIKILLLGNDWWFYPSKSQECYWETSEKSDLVLMIISKNLVHPLRILLISERLGQIVRIEPTNRSAWQQWQSTGLESIEYQWIPLTYLKSKIIPSSSTSKTSSHKETQ